MLVLSRKSGQRLCIADNIEVTIISVRGDRVQLGINAPQSVSIHRAEVQQRINQKQTAAVRMPVPTEGAATCL